MSYDNHATFLSEDWWEDATVNSVEAELIKGADINAKDEDGVLPLIYAVINNKQPEVIETLLTAGADINSACGENGMTALMYAAWYELPDMVDFLLESGADVNAHDDTGATAFDYALYAENEEIADKISAANTASDSNFFNEEWWKTATPEDIAAEILNGEDINAEDEWAHFPLIYAAVFSDNPETVNAVLAAGADVNAVCRADGMTALMYAAWQNANPHVCTVLLNWGADINAQDDEGNTAFEYAQENQNPDVLTLLEEYAAAEEE